MDVYTAISPPDCLRKRGKPRIRLAKNAFNEQKSMRSLAFVLLAAFLVGVTIFCLGGGLRDNDQATLLTGGILFSHGQLPPLHSLIYNYDKQWGSYMLLTVFSLATPGLETVLRGNLLQVLLLLPAILLCLVTLFRSSRTPLWPLLPIFLCPGLVLYLPFLATASLSLAFLFLAFFLSRSSWRYARLPGIPIALGFAAACRGDVVLLVPIIVLSSVPRTTFLGLLRSRLAWWTAIAAVVPVLFGKLIDYRWESDLAGFSFEAASFAGFVTFGLGLGAVVLIALLLATRIRQVWSRAYKAFYLLETFALLIPIVFYWSQLYTARYFFLTLIALLFMATGRRSLIFFQRLPRALPALVCGLAIAPWFAGLSIPSLHAFRVTISEPSGFPTADGIFPFGGYLAFAIHEGGRDHFLVDHNQRTWESAKSVDFRTCNGYVQMIGTPMSSYLDLAMRIQNKTPYRLNNVASSPCGGAYLDLRSVIRRDSEGVFAPHSNLTIVSKRPELGRPIVWMENNRDASAETQTYQELAAYYKGKDAEVFIGTTLREDQPKAGLTDTRFSFAGDCKTIPPFQHICRAGPAISGWARTVFPAFINR